MKRHIPQAVCSTTLFAMAIALASATPAAAQGTEAPRFEVAVNVGMQGGAAKFTASETFLSNGGETATLNVNHAAKSAFAISAGGAVRLVPRLWAGVYYAMPTMKPSASVTAVIPHPILFDTPRTIEGTVAEMTHEEKNLHVDVMYALPFRGLDVRAMAGPTFFNVTQEFVSAVTIDETYPFDTAAFGGAMTRTFSNSAVGFNAGVDISRTVMRRVAIGGIIRYSRAEVTFNASEIGRQTVKAGGVEASAGVRVRF